MKDLIGFLSFLHLTILPGQNKVFLKDQILTSTHELIYGATDCLLFFVLVVLLCVLATAEMHKVRFIPYLTETMCAKSLLSISGTYSQYVTDSYFTYS